MPDRFESPPLPAFTPDVSLFRELPSAPGVYRFHGEDDALLYVGKSINILERVKSHFSARHRDRREHRMTWLTRRISFTETAGEIGALLLENHEIKTRLPLFNRRQRRARQLYTWRLQQDGEWLRPQLSQPLAESNPWQQTGFGVFRSPHHARQMLDALAKQHQLCRKMLLLESGSGPCFARQLRRCAGACCAAESAAEHNQRLLAAMSAHRIEAWPHDSALIFTERSAQTERCDYHVVDQWRWLGSATTRAQAERLIGNTSGGQFDLDSYRILLRALSASGAIKMAP